MITTKQIAMTVQTAKTLLSTINPDRQRKLSLATANKYARDIISGNWNNQGEMFRMSDQGELIDGQHRCQAVVIANRPLPYPVLLVCGVPSSAIHSIDRGKARSMRDVFRLNGFMGERCKVGEIARLRFSLNGKNSPTDQELITLANNHPSYSWAVTALPNIAFIGKAVIRLALAELYERNPSLAKQVAKSLITGEDMSRGNPILTLRNYLLCGSSASGMQNKTQLYKKAVSAFHAALNGESKTKLYGITWPN